MKICALCKKESDLKNSHIIPKFVGRWIKRTSLFGNLRRMALPYERQQDLYKLPLLCASCENLISEFENYFAKTIFYPLNKGFFKTFRKIGSKYCLKYDDHLLKFIISLSIKNLLVSNTKYSDISFPFTNWQSYLLTSLPMKERNAHYLIFWNKIPLDEFQDFEQICIEWYLRRGTDATLASNRDKTKKFLFTHLPSISIISMIEPKYIMGWEDAEIFDQGIMFFPQDTLQKLGFHFKEFIFSRVKPLIEFIRLKEREGYKFYHLKKGF